MTNEIARLLSARYPPKNGIDYECLERVTAILVYEDMLVATFTPFRRSIGCDGRQYGRVMRNAET